MKIEDKLEKRRRLVILAGVGVLMLSVFVSSFLGIVSLMRKKEEIAQTLETKPIESEVISEDEWKGLTEKRLSHIEEMLFELKQKLEEISEREKEAPPPLPLLQVEEEKEEPPPPPQLPPPPPPPPQEVAPPSPPQMKEFDPERISFEVERKEEVEEKKEEPTLFIPLGFADAVLLNGVDAPTLQYGRSNPHPVLLHLRSEVILANNRHLDLRECFVLGSAYGELSSERAYITLGRISCINSQGKIYQRKVEGVVVDADGKTGLRGRLVSKFGSVLAKSFMAGVLDGIARILQASNTVISVSPLGATGTVPPEDAAVVGIASGFSTAAQKLADFYIDLAQEYFPVIEVQAGREVTVVFYGGESLDEVSTLRTSLE